MNAVKPFTIPKKLIWDSYLKVKENGGSAGIDDETIEKFEANLKGNLFTLWNRMSSGSYFPRPVKGVPIPKKTGGERMLGIPSVSDRIAQTAAKNVLESILEPVFHADSYGYRPRKSAHDAIEITRRRCWRYDWVVEFDIKSFFDSLDHQLLLRAVEHHCKIPWVKLYIERWLKTGIKIGEGEMVERSKGTPQGGVISPVLANLFLHYAFDSWVTRELPGVPFCRYADDGILHCKSLKQAEYVLSKITSRFKECGLEIHSEKSKIVYCKDVNRQEEYGSVAFDFLGFTFRPRRAQDKFGRKFINFLPAISQTSQKEIRQTIRRWHLQLKTDKSIDDLSKMLNPVIRGWWNYYGKFHKSQLDTIGRHLDWRLSLWVRRKYKKLKDHKGRAYEYVKTMAGRQPYLFAHWTRWQEVDSRSRMS